eukprot:jgi/Chrpa1/25509/Chrysochromulina_OHIO_Genome00011273-RA
MCIMRETTRSPRSALRTDCGVPIARSSGSMLSRQRASSAAQEPLRSHTDPTSAMPEPDACPADAGSGVTSPPSPASAS